jgi:hypothetical protein
MTQPQAKPDLTSLAPLESATTQGWPHDKLTGVTFIH